MPKNNNRIIVRKSSQGYKTKRGMTWDFRLTFLKRKCEGFNQLEEDAQCADVDDIEIVNLFEVPDGIYEAVVIPGSPDWETGIVEDWSYRLVPYQA